MDHNRELRQYRRLLDSRGDILVGAYAAQQRRRRIAIAVFGLALIGCAVWLYKTTSPRDPATAHGTPAVAVECVNEDCQYRGMITFATADERFPVRCPKCGQRSCYKLWRCRNPDCNHLFLHRGAPADLCCPACGSRAVGTCEELLPGERVE